MIKPALSGFFFGEKMKLCFFLILQFVAVWSFAKDVYVYTNEQGEKVFTDQPPDKKGVKKITVQPANSLQVDADLKKRSKDFFQAQRDAEIAADAEKSKRETLSKNKKKSLKAAQKAYEVAKKLRAGDRLPNYNGGFRYTEQYKKRLAEAEKALDKAKRQAAQSRSASSSQEKPKSHQPQ